MTGPCVLFKQPEDDMAGCRMVSTPDVLYPFMLNPKALWREKNMFAL
jgi:hypothetical protein